MIIERIESTHFRNSSKNSLQLSENLNIFFGKNGSGKSSVIESIYLLGFGRSFRTNKLGSCIQHEKSSFSLFATAKPTVKPDSLEHLKVGLSRSRNREFICQINGERGKKLSELVSLFPIQLFTPQSTDLIIGSPKDRRRFLDWGVFHVEHNYRQCIRSFKLVLRQRNALLKNKHLDTQQVAIWDEKFCELSDSLSLMRKQYIDTFKPIFNEIQVKFLSEFRVELEYNKGWKDNESLLKSIQSRFGQDRQIGLTSVGPHKADIKFKIAGRDASEVLSRGQLRMVVAALLLAQTKAFNAITGSSSIFLLDDLGAELDESRRELFLDELVKTNAQVLVTAIDQEQLKFASKYDNKKMFHVEHGSVKEE